MKMLICLHCRELFAVTFLSTRDNKQLFSKKHFPQIKDGIQETNKMPFVNP